MSCEYWRIQTHIGTSYVYKYAWRICRFMYLFAISRHQTVISIKSPTTGHPAASLPNLPNIRAPRILRSTCNWQFKLAWIIDNQLWFLAMPLARLHPRTNGPASEILIYSRTLAHPDSRTPVHPYIRTPGPTPGPRNSLLKQTPDADQPASPYTLINQKPIYLSIRHLQTYAN